MANAIGADSTDPDIITVITRKLLVASDLILKEAPLATDNVHNEAATRVIEYLFDVSPIGPGGNANIPLIAGRDINIDVLSLSGALSLLARYRRHRAGVVAATAQARAQGVATGNPLTNADLSGNELTFTFQDGTTKQLTLPSGGGMGGGDDFRASASLPSTVTVGDLVFVDGVIYEGIAESRITTQLVRGTSGFDDGFIRNEFGRFNPDIPYIDALFYDDSQDNIELRLNSLSNPGDITLQLPGGRTVAFTDAGRTAYTVAKAGNRQYHAASGDDPFLVGGSSYNITLIYQNSINHWRSWADPEVASWALVGDTGRVPESKIPTDIARVSQIPAPGGGTDDQTAAEVSVNTTAFNRNLSSADDTVQKCLNTLDDLVATAGAGQSATQVRNAIVAATASWALKANDSAQIPASKLADRDGSDVNLDTANFNNNLSSGDNTVQKAMETLDDLVASSSGGGGLSTTEVRALIADWAEQGNTSLIPIDKLRGRTATSRVSFNDTAAAPNFSAGSAPYVKQLTPGNPVNADGGWPITVRGGNFSLPVDFGTQHITPIISGRQQVTLSGAPLVHTERAQVTVALVLRNVSLNTTQTLNSRTLMWGVGEAQGGTQPLKNFDFGTRPVTIVGGDTYDLEIVFSSLQLSGEGELGGDPPRREPLSGRTIQIARLGQAGSFGISRVLGAVKDFALEGDRDISESDMDQSVRDKLNPHYGNIFETLLDEHTFGLSLPSTAASRRTIPVDLPLDLDDVNHGIFITTIDWNLVLPVGGLSLPADTNTSEDATVGALKASPVYANNATNGVLVGTIVFGANRGKVDVYLTRNSNNTVQYYAVFTPGSAGSGTVTATSIQMRTSITFLRTDGALAGGASAASNISLVTTSFNRNLSSSDDTVQKAINKLDDLALSAATASTTTTDTSRFNGNLSSADNTVQKALNTLDDAITATGPSDGLKLRPGYTFTPSAASTRSTLLSQTVPSDVDGLILFDMEFTEVYNRGQSTRSSVYPAFVSYSEFRDLTASRSTNNYQSGEGIALNHTLSTFGAEVTIKRTSSNNIVFRLVRVSSATGRTVGVKIIIHTLQEGSVPGPKGAKGDPGRDGRDGRDGTDGRDGSLGLTEKQKEVFNSFVGNDWETPSTSLVANTFYATKAAAQAARASATFVNTWSKGPADDNKFMLVRVPKADKNTEVTANRYRTRFGSTDEDGIRVTSDNWEHFFDGTTYSYYTVAFTTYGAGESVNVDHFDVFHLEADRLEVIVDEAATEIVSSMTLSANRKEFRKTGAEAQALINSWGTRYKQFLVEVTNVNSAQWLGVSQMLINALIPKPSGKNLYFTGALDSGSASNPEWCRFNLIGTGEVKFNVETTAFPVGATAKIYGVNYRVRQDM